MPTKKAQSGKPASGSTGAKKPNALQKPLQPSKELAAVVGSEPLPVGRSGLFGSEPELFMKVGRVAEGSAAPLGC